jgi:hypothetical protein
MISNSRLQITLFSFLFKKFNIIKMGINIKDSLKLYAVLFSCFIYTQRPSGFKSIIIIIIIITVIYIALKLYKYSKALYIQ